MEKRYDTDDELPALDDPTIFLIIVGRERNEDSYGERSTAMVQCTCKSCDDHKLLITSLFVMPENLQTT